MGYSHLSDHLSDANNIKRFQEETLLLEVASLIYNTMKKRGVSATQLAAHLGVTKGRISQYLGGERNLTLRTLADIFTALDCKLQLDAEPFSECAVWNEVSTPGAVQLKPRKWRIVDQCIAPVGSYGLAG